MRNASRAESDTMGTVEVPANALWGAQTQRSLANFSIGEEKMPIEIIFAITKIKQAAAIANYKLGVLNEDKKDLIVNSCALILKGIHNDQFPLKVWQTGSGTQTNMNVNEVISNLAAISKGEELGSHKLLHPNDDVNKSQSTNDVFPAAIQIATFEAIHSNLLPEIKLLIDSFSIKSQQWEEIIKIGRTHLQDAVPLTLGQEVSAWRDQLLASYKRLEFSLKEICELPLGGTAVGTGLNCPENFDHEITKEISLITGYEFIAAENKFALMASHDGLINVMSQLKLLSVTLLKIFNDIRLLASGPRSGLGELILPANEPGSSIMPGKINPTQCEAIAMVCTQIIGLDSAVSIAGSGGHLQMNVYKPLIGLNLINSIKLLYESCFNCRTLMVEGIKPNFKRINSFLKESLMLVTALSPIIGYKKASEIANHAYKNDITLRESAVALKYISQNKFDELVKPSSMLKAF